MRSCRRNMDRFTQRMLRRATSWIEERKTSHCYPAMFRRRSFILQAVNTDYEYGCYKPQDTGYICQNGAMPTHAALSSCSLDLGDRLEIADSQICDGVFQGGCENEGTVSLPIEQPVCYKNLEHSDTFCETHVHTTSSSSSEPLDPKEQKCCRVLQTCTQHNSESEMIVPDQTYLNQELSLDAAAVAVSVKQRSQMDVAGHWLMTDWENDSLPIKFCFPSYALRTSSVPALHQAVYHCEFSSDTGEAQIINIAQQLSLADEVFEMEGNAEKYTELNSSFSYDMETFLREALGDELLAATRSEPEFCHRNLLPSSTDSERDGSESLFLTVGDYRTLTQLARQKLKPTLPVIPILEPEEPVAAACPLEDAQEKYKESVMQEIYTQKVLMLQYSKAVSICMTTREFHASVERVEAERGLLLSSSRFQAAVKEMKRVQYDQMESDVTERGSVTISSISLSVEKGCCTVINCNSDESAFWFVCIASCGKCVFATQAAKGQQDNKLIFKESFQFVGLPKEFVITLDVYTLQLQTVTLPHKEQYHIQPKQQVCAVPSKPHHKDMQLRVSPYKKSVKRQPVSTTSFKLIGSLHLKLADLHQQPPWILSKVPLLSPLNHEMTMMLHSSLELKIQYSGFLSMMETCGFWQRRWCCLTGHVVRYWNYPHDWPDKPPVGEVDLRQSVSQHVGPVDRSFCPRPRTLLLEIVRQSDADDCNTQENIVRHLWQADTMKELSEWCAKLTAVVSALKRWNINRQTV